MYYSAENLLYQKEKLLQLLHRNIFLIFFWEFHMLKKIFCGWLKTDLF